VGWHPFKKEAKKEKEERGDLILKQCQQKSNVKRLLKKQRLGWLFGIGSHKALHSTQEKKEALAPWGQK
jgi:hypothetical protein